MLHKKYNKFSQMILHRFGHQCRVRHNELVEQEKKSSLLRALAERVKVFFERLTSNVLHHAFHKLAETTQLQHKKIEESFLVLVSSKQTKARQRLLFDAVRLVAEAAHRASIAQVGRRRLASKLAASGESKQRLALLSLASNGRALADRRRWSLIMRLADRCTAATRHGFGRILRRSLDSEIGSSKLASDAARRKQLLHALLSSQAAKLSAAVHRLLHCAAAASASLVSRRRLCSMVHRQLRSKLRAALGRLAVHQHSASAARVASALQKSVCQVKLSLACRRLGDLQASRDRVALNCVRQAAARKTAVCQRARDAGQLLARLRLAELRRAFEATRLQSAVLQQRTAAKARLATKLAASLRGKASDCLRVLAGLRQLARRSLLVQAFVRSEETAGRLQARLLRTAVLSIRSAARHFPQLVLRYHARSSQLAKQELLATCARAVLRHRRLSEAAARLCFVLAAQPAEKAAFHRVRLRAQASAVLRLQGQVQAIRLGQASGFVEAALSRSKCCAFFRVLQKSIDSGAQSLASSDLLGRRKELAIRQLVVAQRSKCQQLFGQVSLCSQKLRLSAEQARSKQLQATLLFRLLGRNSLLKVEQVFSRLVSSRLRSSIGSAICAAKTVAVKRIGFVIGARARDAQAEGLAAIARGCAAASRTRLHSACWQTLGSVARLRLVFLARAMKQLSDGAAAAGASRQKTALALSGVLGSLSARRLGSAFFRLLASRPRDFSHSLASLSSLVGGLLKHRAARSFGVVAEHARLKLLRSAHASSLNRRAAAALLRHAQGLLLGRLAAGLRALQVRSRSRLCLIKANAVLGRLPLIESFARLRMASSRRDKWCSGLALLAAASANSAQRCLYQALLAVQHAAFQRFRFPADWLEKAASVLEKRQLCRALRQAAGAKQGLELRSAKVESLCRRLLLAHKAKQFAALRTLKRAAAARLRIMRDFERRVTRKLEHSAELLRRNTRDLKIDSMHSQLKRMGLTHIEKLLSGSKSRHSQAAVTQIGATASAKQVARLVQSDCRSVRRAAIGLVCRSLQRKTRAAFARLNNHRASLDSEARKEQSRANRTAQAIRLLLERLTQKHLHALGRLRFAGLDLEKIRNYSLARRNAIRFLACKLVKSQGLKVGSSFGLMQVLKLRKKPVLTIDHFPGKIFSSRARLLSTPKLEREVLLFTSTHNPVPKKSPLVSVGVQVEQTPNHRRKPTIESLETSRGNQTSQDQNSDSRTNKVLFGEDTRRALLRRDLLSAEQQPASHPLSDRVQQPSDSKHLRFLTANKAIQESSKSLHAQGGDIDRSVVQESAANDEDDLAPAPASRYQLDPHKLSLAASSAGTSKADYTLRAGGDPRAEPRQIRAALLTLAVLLEKKLEASSPHNLLAGALKVLSKTPKVLILACVVEGVLRVEPTKIAFSRIKENLYVSKMVNIIERINLLCDRSRSRSQQRALFRAQQPAAPGREERAAAWQDWPFYSTIGRMLQITESKLRQKAMERLRASEAPNPTEAAAAVSPT